MKFELKEIKMHLNGIDLSCFDLPSSMTAYGTREVILKNEFKFDLFPMEDGSNYVEVGSHNGLLGFYVARLFPKVNVHLFECNPLMIKAIQIGILKNNLNNITVYPFGLSSKNTTSKFLINPTNTGGSSLLTYDDRMFEIEVTLYDFETILSVFKSIDYLKIDIEGAEFEIFNKLIEVDSYFLERVKTLNLELHDNIYSNLNLDRGGIKEFISEFKDLNVIYQG